MSHFDGHGVRLIDVVEGVHRLAGERPQLSGPGTGRQASSRGVIPLFIPGCDEPKATGKKSSHPCLRRVLLLILNSHLVSPVDVVSQKMAEKKLLEGAMITSGQDLHQQKKGRERAFLLRLVPLASKAANRGSTDLPGRLHNLESDAKLPESVPPVMDRA